jgi:peptidoglycan hydrolase-like protein with peptidoglycan-binding domain
MLNAVRGAGLTVDGIFGTKTKNAVISFQTAQGLTADGICGAKTWAALVTAYNALQSSSSSTSSTTTYNYSAIAKATAETQKIKSGCVLTAYSTLVKAKLYTEGKSYSGISQYTIYGYNGNVVNADWNKINRNIESKAGTSGTLTYEGRSGYSASANRQYIADLLSTRPEGVLVYFYKNDNNQHAVRFCNYDAASGTFYVSDPGSSSYVYTTLQKSSIGNGKYTWGSGYFGYVNKVVYYK